MALLDIENLHIEFPSRHGHVVAIQDVSLSLEKGEILGVVGESGAGKSTIGNAVIWLLEPRGKMTQGTVLLNDERSDQLPPHALREVRCRRIALIFQDPLPSLVTLQTDGHQLTQTFQLHLPTHHHQDPHPTVKPITN